MDLGGLTRPLDVERNWAARSGWLLLAALAGALLARGSSRAIPPFFVLGLAVTAIAVVGLAATLVRLPRWTAGSAVVAVCVLGTVVPWATVVEPGLATGRREDLPADAYGAVPAGPGRTLISHDQGWSLLTDGQLVPLADHGRSQDVAVSTGPIAVVITDRIDLEDEEEATSVITAYGVDGDEAWTRRIPFEDGDGLVEVAAAYDDGTVALSTCATEACQVDAVAADGTAAWSTTLPDRPLVYRPRQLGDNSVQTLPGFVAGIIFGSRAPAGVSVLHTIDRDGGRHEVEVDEAASEVATGLEVVAVLDQRHDGTCGLQAFDVAGGPLSDRRELPCSDDPSLAVYLGTPDVYDPPQHHVLDLETGQVIGREDVEDEVVHHTYGTAYIERRPDLLRFDVGEDGTARFEVSHVVDLEVAEGTLVVLRELTGTNPFRNDDLREVAVIDPATGRTCASWRSDEDLIEIDAVGNCRAMVSVRSDGPAFLLGPSS